MRVGVAAGTGLLMAALSCGGASAQNDLMMPVMDTGLTAPRFFEGLYAGFYLGGTGNERGNFITAPGIGRYWGGGPVLGYNYYLSDDTVLGVEVRGGAATDFAGNASFDVFGLAHLGFPIANNFMPYYIGGAGWFHSAPAYALGVGFEWGLFDNAGFHMEAITFGAVGPTPGPVQYPGISAWQVTAGLVWHLGEGINAHAEEELFRPRYDVTDFSGLYTSAYFGGVFNPFTYNFFPDTGNGRHLTRGAYGAAIGWNQEIADSILAGVELQGSFLFDTSGDITGELTGLGKVGLRPVEGLFVYAEGGVGILQGRPFYALGGGAEWAAWGKGGLRADVMAIGELMPASPANAGITAAKVLIGPTWHFD